MNSYDVTVTFRVKAEDEDGALTVIDSALLGCSSYLEDYDFDGVELAVL